MIILHIASVDNNPYSGVCNVVPKHVQYQSDFAEVALLNICEVAVPADCRQLPYKRGMSLKQLANPFAEPDLIIFHEVYYLDYLPLASEASKLTIPYIIIPHGCLTVNAQQHKHLKKIVGNALLFNRFIKSATAIQFLSDNEAANSHYNLNSIICSNGIEIPRFKKRYIKADNERINIVYIGRLDIKSKALDLMLDAIELISDYLVDNNCVVSIYGPDQDDMYRYINNRITKGKLNDCVSLNHPVLGDEKKHVLENADLFIQSSRSEGMPMGILEAMSYGLPCIVTYGTTLGELISSSSAGWSSSNNPESFSKSIIEAINSKNKWQEYSNNAKSITREMFSWDVIAKDTVDKYKEIVSTYYKE